MKIKYSGKRLSFYEELIRDYQDQQKIFGISDLYVEFGMYYEQVKRYYDQFGLEQVKVIIFEEFIQQPEQTVNEILRFLGVDFAVHSIRQIYNRYSVPRTPIAIWIYSFFRWLRVKNTKSYKILNRVPETFTESIPERLLFKKAQKPEIEPTAKSFLRQIYYDDCIKLQLLLGRSLPWSTISSNKTNQ